MTKLFISGFVVACLGGMALDTQGKGYNVAVALIILGLIVMAFSLIQSYVLERKRQDKYMDRILAKYKDDYLY